MQIVCAYLYVISKYGYPPPADASLNYLREMKALGFSYVELEGIREKHLMDMYKIREDIAEQLNALELQLPVYCTVLPKLLSPIAGVRARQLELFRFGCETAQSFGARYILDNCPVAPFEFPEDLPVVRHYDEAVLADARLPKDFSWPNFYELAVSTYQGLCDIAKEYSLTYLMHPAVGTLFATPISFLAFRKNVDRENLGYNFDTANLIALQQNLSLSLRQLIDYTPYIHISDTSLKHHQHLPLGGGDINWDVFFEDLDNLDFDGLVGVDIGGDESGVADLDAAYREAREKIEAQLIN